MIHNKVKLIFNEKSAKASLITLLFMQPKLMEFTCVISLTVNSFSEEPLTLILCKSEVVEQFYGLNFVLQYEYSCVETNQQLRDNFRLRS